MRNFYCNICNEDVTLQNGKCPKCKTDWNKIINEKISDDNTPIDVYKNDVANNNYNDENEYEDKSVITEENIKNNIEFFLMWAFVGKIFMIIIALVFAIISFAEIELTNGYSLMLLILSAGFVFAGIIFENNLKWKAYMLHTNIRKD